jgi:hypothetical protein
MKLGIKKTESAKTTDEPIFFRLMRLSRDNSPPTYRLRLIREILVK